MHLNDVSYQKKQYYNWSIRLVAMMQRDKNTR